MAPSFTPWEPLLTGQGYRFALFDGLNRYYAAEEHPALMERLADAPAGFGGILQFRSFKAAAGDPSHPDHGLARLLADLDPVRLPLVSSDTLVSQLISDLDPGERDRPAQPKDMAAAHLRLFGRPPAPRWESSLGIKSGATVRDLYCSAIKTDA